MSFYFRLTEVTLCLDEVRNKYSSCFVFNYIGYMNPHPPVYTLQIWHEHSGFFHSLIFYLKLTMGLLSLLCLVFLAMVLFLCRLQFSLKNKHALANDHRAFMQFVCYMDYLSTFLKYLWFEKDIFERSHVVCWVLC